MGREKKNLIGDGDQYSAYYGNFRGVDFSSDHTQVDKRRFAYLVNMYKDYQSAQGQAIETIPGFRAVMNLPEAGGSTIYGIHEYVLNWKGRVRGMILVHMGKRLYAFKGYPESVNVKKNMLVTLGKEVSNTNGTKTFRVGLTGTYAVYSVSKLDGTSIDGNWSYSPFTLTISRGDLSEGDTVNVVYSQDVLEYEDAIFTDMNEQKSVSFTFNNRLYIIDGKNYLVYDAKTISSVVDNAYIPLTYKAIVPGETEISDAGKEYEQRNVLQPKFRNSFVADGVTKEYYLNEKELDNQDVAPYDRYCQVEAYGEVLPESAYEVDYLNGKITFAEPPEKAEAKGFPEGHDGIVITAKKTFKASFESTSGISTAPISEFITRCTIACVFDNRVFMSGNPFYPNHVYYCENNANTGYMDPTFFGVFNYLQDGAGAAPITGMLPVSGTLTVLKADSKQDGAIYYHSPVNTGENIVGKIYNSIAGLPGTGCLGACINFLDDPVFVSRLGLEAVGQLSTRNERAIEHRSTLVDAKLVNVDLTSAQPEEWNGYLLLLVDGKVFMADSRQRYADETGIMQYEWYYLEDIGKHEGQYEEFKYARSALDEVLKKTVRVCDGCHRPLDLCNCDEPNGKYTEVPFMIADKIFDVDTYETEDLTGTTANFIPSIYIYSENIPIDADDVTYSKKVHYTLRAVYDPVSHIQTGLGAYICETKGNLIGGTFYPATCLKSMNNTLYFGANGTIFAFNFDKRGENGEIPAEYYTFNGRTIFSGCATKMDDCDIPHLTKSTVKKSTVIKTKTLDSSALKIKVRTNKKPYEQISRVNTGRFSFGAFDFADLTFNTQDHGLSTVREKEKKWVEKQYFIYSDEFMKPFAIYNLAYRYKIAGRYKE